MNLKHIFYTLSSIKIEHLNYKEFFHLHFFVATLPLFLIFFLLLIYDSKNQVNLPSIENFLSAIFFAPFIETIIFLAYEFN